MVVCLLVGVFVSRAAIDLFYERYHAALLLFEFLCLFGKFDGWKLWVQRWFNRFVDVGLHSVHNPVMMLVNYLVAVSPKPDDDAIATSDAAKND